MQKGKIVSLEDRIPKIKEHRKRKANRRLILLLSLFFLLIACVVYFQSPLSHIKRIDVAGNDFLSDNEIIAASGLQTGDHIWKTNMKGISGQLQKLPEIKEGDVHWQFPNTIKIEVVEHQSIAYLSEANQFKTLLENGDILPGHHQATDHSGAPILVDFKQGDVLEDLAAELQRLPVEILNAISEIHYKPKKTDKYAIHVFMNDGYEINATIPTFSEKMVYYPSYISQLDVEVKGVIDLEVGSYFRAYETEGMEEESDQEE